jgi:hypothetical protein
MPYELEPRHTYLLVSVHGPVDLREGRAVLTAALRACAEHGLSKVLIDARSVEGGLSVLDRYDYADFMSRQLGPGIGAGGLLGVRIAAVGREPLISPGRLGETVAANRGVDLKITDSMDEALEWLEVEADSQG